jgi:hypothetical protein
MGWNAATLIGAISSTQKLEMACLLLFPAEASCPKMATMCADFG